MTNTVISYCFWLLLLACFIHKSYALECYVCTDQEDNKGKCLTTIKTCEQGQDVCLTEINWGSTPYWSQGAKKQFYISKRCSTKRECERIHKANMPDCTHIWYQDWKCSECCQGDKCNSFIMSGTTTLDSSTTLTLASAAAILLMYKQFTAHV